MRHFHVIRWNSVSLSTGEQIAVPDVDYASVTGAAEAERLAALAGGAGDRTGTYECSDRCCTLHAPRTLVAPLPTPA